MKLSTLLVMGALGVPVLVWAKEKQPAATPPASAGWAALFDACAMPLGDHQSDREVSRRKPALLIREGNFGKMEGIWVYTREGAQFLAPNGGKWPDRAQGPTSTFQPTSEVWFQLEGKSYDGLRVAYKPSQNSALHRKGPNGEPIAEYKAAFKKKKESMPLSERIAEGQRFAAKGDPDDPENPLSSYSTFAHFESYFAHPGKEKLPKGLSTVEAQENLRNLYEAVPRNGTRLQPILTNHESPEERLELTRAALTNLSAAMRHLDSRDKFVKYYVQDKQMYLGPGEAERMVPPLRSEGLAKYDAEASRLIAALTRCSAHLKKDLPEAHELIEAAQSAAANLQAQLQPQDVKGGPQGPAAAAPGETQNRR